MSLRWLNTVPSSGRARVGWLSAIALGILLGVLFAMVLGELGESVFSETWQDRL